MGYTPTKFVSVVSSGQWPFKPLAVRTRFYLVCYISAGSACIDSVTFSAGTGTACEDRPDEAQPRRNNGKKQLHLIY
ncbi:MAG: hypothetical protein LBD53_02560 [Tannerella sp.]|nr:hypothetical protein [Tannerella sp.]